jgi:adenine-specific DNA-methyltransferase
MSKDKTKFVPGSVDLFKENIDKLKELFPQVVTDGEIDFEMLKSILDKNLADSKEKYQFTWNGKSRTIKLAQSPSNATLLPSIKDSKNWDTTENLYIEGDNLEVLKLLQKTYFNKIKMIYIDPPYNTGGDFVYKDDFKDTIKNYKEQTEQTTRVNPETSGRYHTDWLNMMYSRLMLAKNLLSDDGVIFVSIDDNEVENLKKMMNEIFGENNFVAQIVRKTRSGGGYGESDFGVEHDYVIVLSKNRNITKFEKLAKSDVEVEKYFNKKDYKGAYHLRELKQSKNQEGKRENRPFMFFPFILENGNISLLPETENKKLYINGKFDDIFLREIEKKYELILPILADGDFGRWTCGYDYAKKLIENDNIEIIDKVVYKKERITDDKKGKVLTSIMSDAKYSNNQGGKDLKNIFEDNIFDFPKPLDLIKTLLNLLDENCYVLDFFSGSATTAHAVMQLNAEDGGNRKFIMVQLPEKTNEDSEAFKAGYKNICEIGKERIRKAGELVKKDLIEKNAKLDKDQEKVDPNKLDIGFKVFKLEESNFKEWDSSKEPTIEQLELFADPIKEGKSEEDVLYEVLLKYGVFDQEVKKIKINKKDVYSISDNYLIVMLSNKITLEDVEEIKKLKPKIVIFRDSGFNGNDTIKINAFYTLTKTSDEKDQVEVKSV